MLLIVKIVCAVSANEMLWSLQSNGDQMLTQAVTHSKRMDITAINSEDSFFAIIWFH